MHLNGLILAPSKDPVNQLKNEGGFLSLEQFQDKYGIISTFLEYNGLLKAIPMKFIEVIAVNNKLEKGEKLEVLY
jgi:hypothetical protein